MKVELKLEGMTCLDCARTLEEALRAVPGVERASVSYGAKRASVTATDELAVDDLLEVAERAGYRAEVAEGGGARVSASPPEQRERAGRPASARGDRTADAGVDYDLLIIGSGGAGMAAATRASGLGATAGIVAGARRSSAALGCA